MNSEGSRGFALPTILIAGLVAMMVLMTALTASSSVRVALDEQYYQQLAREAAESGVAFARDCLKNNGNISSWAGKTLTPKTNCAGNNVGSYDGYVMQSGNVETTYIVDDLPADVDQTQIRVTGLAKLKRSTDGSVWRSYKTVQFAGINGLVGTSSLAFGYNFAGDEHASNGVFVGVIGRDGSVLSLGQNNYGQLGQGNTTVSTTPAPYILPAGVYAKALYANNSSLGRALFAITTDGDVYATGQNSSGHLGVGLTPTTVTTPTKVDIGSEKAAYVASNGSTSFIVTESGEVLSSGSCRDGILGNGTGGSFCSNRSAMGSVSWPTDSGAGLATDKFAFDENSAFVITTTGRVYAWGKNNFGQLGIPGAPSTATSPTRISRFGTSASTSAVAIATDGNTTYVLQANGQLFAMGDNSNYQFSYSRSNATSPIRIDDRIRTESGACAGAIIDIKTDNQHTAVLTDDGAVCTFGVNNVGQLGHGVISANATAKEVLIPSSRQAASIAVSGVDCSACGTSLPSNTYIVTTDGYVYGVGSNRYLQLGSTFSGTNISNPRSIAGFGPTNPAAEIEAGLGTAIIRTTSGRLYGLGNNTWGQLGNGTTTNSRTITPIDITRINQPITF